MRGEADIMAERNEENHRAGGQRHAHDPAADGRSPFPAGQAGGTDDDQCQDQFQYEDVHRDTILYVA